METPVPKPRTAAQGEAPRRPVPAPRTRPPASAASAPAADTEPPAATLPASSVNAPAERVSATDILRSIGTVTRQISEDVAAKVTISAKTANEKIERSLIDGSRFAKDTLEKTIITSKVVRDSVTKSVLDSTRTVGLRMRQAKKNDKSEESPRCVSMPAVDMSLFDNIQFHSPLLEQKKYVAEKDYVMSSSNCNAMNVDDLSILSSNSDSNADTVSNFSYDSRDSEQNSVKVLEAEQLTYDTPRSSRTNSITKDPFIPEVPERRKKRQSQGDTLKLNSIYENWTLPYHHESKNNNEIAISSDQHNCDQNPRPSQSTIYEFDPLNNTDNEKFSGVSNELLLLESFLIGDNYGTIVSTDNSDNNEDSYSEYCETDYFNPPTPPERSDSLFSEEIENKSRHTASADKDRNSNWYIGESDSNIAVGTDTDNGSKSTHTIKQKISDILKLDNVLHKTWKQSTQQKTEHSSICQLPAAYFSGMLNISVSGGMEDLFKGSQARYCVLSDQKLICYSDPTNLILKEAYPLENINSVQVVLPLSASGPDSSYKLEVSVGGGGRRVVLASAGAGERRAWAQRLAEHLAGAAFPAAQAADYTRLGRCVLKEGVTGAWRGAWLLLSRRVLLASAAEGGAEGGAEGAAVHDLRKARCIATQAADEAARRAGGAGGVLLVDCARAALYLRLPTERDLKEWRGMVRLAASSNGPALHHQQLTPDDVPVIVDKCISFVCAHGSLSEGIYRRAGSAGGAAALAAALRRDARGTALAADAHSEHDVAAVLKRFFRDLPHPLLPRHLHLPLAAAAEVEEETARTAALRRLVEAGLGGREARATARRLFAHLAFVASLAHANRMTADNLAAVWAPTLMHHHTGECSGAWLSRSAGAVRALTAQWAGVWRATAGELARDAAVRAVLQRVLDAARPLAPLAPAAPAAPAGHLRIYVYVADTDTSVQLELVPARTSVEVAEEAWLRAGRARGAGSRLALVEAALGGALARRLPPHERPLPAALRWAYWDHDDRKDNYFLVREEAPPPPPPDGPPPPAAELRFASPASRSFRQHHFELRDRTLVCYKDKQRSTRLAAWAAGEHVWFAGHERRRPPPPRAPHALTFVPAGCKPPRSRDKPWFGACLAFGDAAERDRWAAALWAAAAPAPPATPAPAAPPAPADLLAD